MPETATTNPGMPDRARALVAWLLAPATEEVPRHHQLASAALRILLGLMWLYNVSWKRAPDFGREAGNGLYKFTSYAVSDPVFPPYSWVVEHVVLKAFTPFGWLVLAMETLLAVLLLTGAWVRLAALVGVAQSLAIGLSVAYAPHEWPWSYWLMIGAHVAILGSSAGRVLAVDAVRAGLTDGRLLRRVFGGVAVAARCRGRPHLLRRPARRPRHPLRLDRPVGQPGRVQPARRARADAGRRWACWCCSAARGRVRRRRRRRGRRAVALRPERLHRPTARRVADGRGVLPVSSRSSPWRWPAGATRRPPTDRHPHVP